MSDVIKTLAVAHTAQLWKDVTQNLSRVYFNTSADRKAFNTFLNKANSTTVSDSGQVLSLFYNIDSLDMEHLIWQKTYFNELNSDHWKMIRIYDNDACQSGYFNKNDFGLGYNIKYELSLLDKYLSNKPQSINLNNTSPPVNDHTCIRCGNTKCSKSEPVCWKCGCNPH